MDALRLHIEELLMSFHWGDLFHSHDFLYPPSSHNHVANLMKTWFHTLLAHMGKRSCTRARGSIYVSFKSQTLKKMMLFSKEEEKHLTQCVQLLTKTRPSIITTLFEGHVGFCFQMGESPHLKSSTQRIEMLTQNYMPRCVPGFQNWYHERNAKELHKKNQLCFRTKRSWILSY